MRLSTILSTAICLFSIAEANVGNLTIPATIKIGEEFVANFLFPIQQPRDVAIVWGVGPSTAQIGEIGGYGSVGVTRLDSSDVSGTGYNRQIVHGLKIHSGTVGGGGPLVIQAVISGYLGAAGNLFLQSRYFRVNATLDGPTSTELVGDVEDFRRSVTWPSP